MCSRSRTISFIVLLLQFLSSFLFFPLTLHAASDPDQEDIQQLDTVFVSATKTPTPVSQLTSAGEVFTAEDIEIRQIRTVVDALRLSQGTAVFSNGGPGTSANVRIRGGNARQTLVLIDGAIMNSGTLGSYNFSNLTTDNIEKIEILRGAQSSLWGADATGGVINITTKRGKGPVQTGAFVEYGSFNTLREGGTLSGQKGILDFSMALSRLDTSGISAINTRRGATERDSFRNWQASSRLGVNLPKDGRFDFNFRWLNSDTQIDSSFGPSDVIKARNRSKRFIFSGIYAQPFTNWWTHTLTLARSQESSPFDPGTQQRNLSSEIVSVPFGGSNDTRVKANRIETQHDFELGTNATLTLGYQFREQIGKNTTGLSENITSSHGGFAQIQGNVFDRLFGTAGIRHDRFNTFGDATTYRVTGAYLHKETNTKVRGSYATGFRAPTINELFFPNFGNPNLEPEKSQSLDVGIDQFFFHKRVKVSVGYFWNRYRGLIETIQNVAICGVGPFGTNFCPVNVSSAKTQGWETSVSLVLAQDAPFIKVLDIQAQYTMTLTRNLNTGARLGRWPVDQVSVRVRYQPVDPINVTLDFRFIGSQFNLPSTAQDDTQRVPSFKVVNLSASYDVTKQFQIFTRVENLLNEKYEEVLFFGTPVRSIYGGVRVNFEFPVLSDSQSSE